MPDMAVMCTSRATPPEAMEQDPTQASAPESTDTEMYQAVERDLLITNDYEAGLVRNAAKAHGQVAGGDGRSGDVRNVQFKEPDGGEAECYRTTGQRPRTEERGQSILKKETVNTATGAIPW